eukprot:957285-Ditylum_brightwellii.AAC.1
MSILAKANGSSGASTTAVTRHFCNEPSWYIALGLAFLVVVSLTDSHVVPVSIMLNDMSTMIWNTLLLCGMHAAEEIFRFLGLSDVLWHPCLTTIHRAAKGRILLEQPSSR